ncbi:MAG: MazG nucleotide pyrophosphohydrolase domain-containing protein [Elusimicrobia bacterium]|nr:MazG nucleotide pyrophosphohydrolase domain-containing protein [Elusimicrobiota bacterium]
MSKKFDELVKVFDKLLSPEGCKWDLKQTHKSLLKYLKEETNEFIDAVKAGDISNMEEELGDILLQVMFHSQLAKKQKQFTIEDVIDTLVKKLKRRHPHIFSDKKVKSVKEIITNWHKIKKLEKKQGRNREKVY